MRRQQPFVKQAVCTLLTLLALMLVAQIGLVSAAGQPQVNICHFDKDAGIWKKINIGSPAVAAHLGNHDDSLPGGTTSKTSTELDENCQPRPTGCGNCSEAHGSPGCSDTDCQNTVCANDSFCCDTAWDSICVEEALDLCDCGAP